MGGTQRRTRNSGTPPQFTPASSADFPSDTDPERLHAPLLLPSHLAAWQQTNPAPVVDPPVEPFLHGIRGDRETARPSDVHVVWRHDRSQAALNEVPPRLSEQMTVPYAAAVAWLGTPSSSRVEISVADAGQPAAWASLAGLVDASSSADGSWCRWSGHDSPPEVISVDEIRPGDLLIVDPLRGGQSQRTWDPYATDPVPDLGDAAHAGSGRRVTLRLDPRLWSAAVPAPPRPSPDADEDQADIKDWLGRLTRCENAPEWARTAASVLADGFSIHRIGDDTNAYYALCNTSGLEAGDMDGSDHSDSVTGTAVTLSDHLDGVAELARAYAERIGFSRELCDDIALAARLHDIGKADPQYQRQLLGQDDIALMLLDAPLAKSPPGVRPDPAGWPAIRHEFISVLMAEQSGQVAAAHDPDLVLHLIGSHHGDGRALPLLRPDHSPRDVHYGSLSASTAEADAALADRMASRFERLNRRYGPFGLAWFETVLRLADHQQSAAERNAT